MALYMQRVSGFTVPSSPHFDDVSTPYFLERLQASHSYLEFGSGGSTFLAAKLGKSFTTVESDRFFLKAVERKIEAAGQPIDRSKQRLLHVDIGLTEAWGKPLFLKPTPSRLGKWKRYFTAPWEDGAKTCSPDLILVDGRFRVACALSTALHLADRSEWTLLFDDYVGRDHYQPVEQFLERVDLIGRMAVFKQKSGVDRIALSEALVHFGADWR